MFDKGRLAYILYETALDISDLEAAKKKAAYLQAIAVRPNDKAMLERAFKKFKRDSFELFQLQELRTARTEEAEVQYRVGSILFSNFSELASTWSRL